MKNLLSETGDEIFNIRPLCNFPDTQVVLFNVRDLRDFHWVAAVEVYVEEKLRPWLRIPAKHQG